MDVGKPTLSVFYCTGCGTNRTIPDTYLLGTREERERKREVERIHAQHRLDASLKCTGNREGRRTRPQQRHEITPTYMYKCTKLNTMRASSRAQPRQTRRPYAHTQIARWSLCRKHTGIPQNRGSLPSLRKNSGERKREQP